MYSSLVRQELKRSWLLRPSQVSNDVHVLLTSTAGTPAFMALKPSQVSNHIFLTSTAGTPAFMALKPSHVSDDVSLTSAAGTPAFFAPETLTGKL